IAEADLDGLRTMYLASYLLSRVAIGAGAATVLYFIFQADLIQGAVFPKLSELGFATIQGKTSNYGFHVPNQQLSALLVWSFLAGFSETLVPAFLEGIQKNAQSKKSNGD
ncbi:MAG: hypothetical protein AAGI70_15275, partial [Pseudomonadota bacterium]